MNKVFNLLVLCSLMMLNCCSPTSSPQNANGAYPDSLFRYQKIKLVANDSLGRDYDREAIDYKLRKLASDDRTQLTDRLFGSAHPYGAYFYSKQSRINEMTPVLVLANLDDYQSVIMFLVSDKSEVKNHIELTLYTSYVAEQKGDRETVAGHQRYSEFLNDSTIRMTDLRVLIDGYEKDDEITITDSLSIDYRISSQGKINQIRKDSVRYNKRKG